MEEFHVLYCCCSLTHWSYTGMDKQWFNRSNRNLLGVNKIIRWRLRLNVTGFRQREVQELSRWPIYGPVDTKNAQHLKVTKMHWHHTVQMVMETLVTIGEKSYNRFHWPPGALFEGFRFFDTCQHVWPAGKIPKSKVI